MNIHIDLTMDTLERDLDAIARAVSKIPPGILYKIASRAVSALYACKQLLLFSSTGNGCK